MLEAKISYSNGRTHTIEANTIESLKSKCQPFIDDPNVCSIYMVKLINIGWLKSPLDLELFGQLVPKSNNKK